MNKSNVLVNYRHSDNLTDREKYELNLEVQLEISKVMHRLADEKKISNFSTADNDYIEELLSYLPYPVHEDYKKALL